MMISVSSTCGGNGLSTLGITIKLQEWQKTEETVSSREENINSVN